MKNMRGFSEEVFVLYNKKFLSQQFSEEFIISIQDIFVLNCSNVIFIEYSEEKRNQIRNYIKKIKSNDTYLIILGNHNIIPFEAVKSPVNDGDNYVYTDNYWNCYDRYKLIPDFPVCRIPIPEDYDKNKIIDMIERIMSKRTINHKERLGVTASIWKKAASHVFKSIRGTGDMLISPPFSVENNGVLNFCGYSGTVYCNVHGSDTEPGWYGQAKNNDNENERFPLVLLPETFKEGFDNAYLVSEACYGGLINGKRIDNSIALTAVCSSMTFTLLSTSTAYGTYFPPLSEADMLVNLFYKNIYKGFTAGKALVKAKRDFAAANIENNGFLDNDDKKTLLEFLIYGNALVRETK